MIVILNPLDKIMSKKIDLFQVRKKGVWRSCFFRRFALSLCLICYFHANSNGQDTTEAVPKENYQLFADWAELPSNTRWGPVSSVAIDADGTVHAFRREGAILTFDKNGAFLKSWGEGIAKWTHGLEIDREGFIWATDGEGHQVKKFTPQGELLLALGKYDVAGDGPNSFNRPTDVVVAENGEFYVADGYGNSRIVKFSKDGRYIMDWGSKGTAPGQFDTPHALALDSRQRLFVGDRGNKRIQIFDGEGNFLDEWTHLGIPYGIDISRDDWLYVADGVTNQVMIANARDGQVIEIIEGSHQVHWVSVDPWGDVYVASNRDQSLKKFVKKARKND